MMTSVTTIVLISEARVAPKRTDNFSCDGNTKIARTAAHASGMKNGAKIRTTKYPSNKTAA